MIQNLREKRVEAQEFDAWLANSKHYKLEVRFSNESVLKVSHNNGLWSDLILAVLS